MPRLRASIQGLRSAELARSDVRDSLSRIMSLEAQPRASTGELVLVVNDDDGFRRLVQPNLENAGFRIAIATSSEAALRTARRLQPAVVVVDVRRPEISGAELCSRIREEPDCTDIGVLWMAGCSTEEERLRGFEAGADDVVIPPFGVREFVMRVRNVAARARDRRVARKALEPARSLAWHGLVMDSMRHRVAIEGVELALRPLEYRLLAIFLNNPHKLLTRKELLREVWGLCPDTNTGTVDTHIRRLRERLGPYSHAIETVHGFGYRLRSSNKSDAPP
jgi:two-component system phosphate regulon response regulator PhoB